MKIKDIITVLLPVLLLPAGCSTEDDASSDTGMPDSAAGISAMVSRAPGEQDSDAESYLHNSFILDRSVIRVVNTLNYATPDFRNSAYEYVYTTEGIAWEDDEPNFFPLLEGSEYGDEDRVDENGGIDNDAIVPTSNAFIFEAACYPIYYEPFDAVWTDQSNEDDFLASDLLLAYTRKSLDDRYGLLKLRFWHVFSMVRIELKLPIADTDSDNGFPEDDPQGERTVSGVTLDDMYTTYTVRYTEAINSGEARTVAATSDGGRTDIRMYRLPYADDTVEENGVRYQICQFAAIVPVQQIRTQETLLTMNIRTIVGIGEDGSQVVLEKAYTYTPSRLIDMQQGKITVLRLDASTDDSEPVLLSAEVQPWNPSWTETELLPE